MVQRQVSTTNRFATRFTTIWFVGVDVIFPKLLPLTTNVEFATIFVCPTTTTHFITPLLSAVLFSALVSALCWSSVIGKDLENLRCSTL